VAIDLYDGSVMYDFATGETRLCDIDLYRRAPTTNDVGRMWGSSRFMSPEECERGATLDEVTNVYALGAFAFAVFGDERTKDPGVWRGPAELLTVAMMATRQERSQRYTSITALRQAWIAAVLPS
jgi:serine/threonine protein kinase, bacterial